MIDNDTLSIMIEHHINMHNVFIAELDSLKNYIKKPKPKVEIIQVDTDIDKKKQTLITKLRKNKPYNRDFFAYLTEDMRICDLISTGKKYSEVETVFNVAEELRYLLVEKNKYNKLYLPVYYT